MADTILRGVSNDGTIRIFAAETTELAEFYELVCEQTSYVSALREKGDMR